jgi:hypothetical protein
MKMRCRCLKQIGQTSRLSSLADDTIRLFRTVSASHASIAKPAKPPFTNHRTPAVRFLTDHSSNWTDCHEYGSLLSLPAHNIRRQYANPLMYTIQQYTTDNNAMHKGSTVKTCHALSQTLWISLLETRHACLSKATAFLRVWHFRSRQLVNH